MKILLGMSGGLDSTYAAYLMREQGWEVEGAVLQMHDYTEIEDARASAQAVGIPFHVIDCRERFARCVQEPFIDEYLCGRTPNPCILCNRDVKFAALYEYAMSHGFDRIGTGHYSRIVCEDGRYAVHCADDAKKDQSYVLWRLTQEQLAVIHTPLASLCKDDIRQKAEALGFSAAHKKESQEICFIPDHDYAAYITARRGNAPEGDFVDRNGKIVGRHRGILHYTVGQRKHLGIALGEPVYVSAIDPETNRVYLAQAGGEYTDSMEVSALNFQRLDPEHLPDTIDAAVRIRYSSPMIPAHVTFRSEADGVCASVRFDAPVRAVTPGQSAVFYADGTILFGGFIRS